MLDQSGGTDGISAQPLAPIDPSWAGSLGAADRALPKAMWAGTARNFVVAALPLLQPTTSPALQDLDRRLLLSDANPPAGADPSGRPGLAALRLDRLLALGRSDGAALVDALPPALVTAAMDQNAVELKIAAGDQTGACAMVRDRVARYRDAWWNRAVVACQALGGDFDQASLGLSALREQKTMRDPLFETLIEAILGRRQTLDKLPNPTPLTLALLAAAKLPLPADALATASPGALAVYATSDKLPASDRLAAGEKAAAFGAIPPAALGLLYTAFDATTEEQAAALKSGAADSPRRRAILYNIARRSPPDANRIAALTALLSDARRRGAFVLTALLVAPLVSELPPTAATQDFAPLAARVLLAAHAFDQAAPWVTRAGQPELAYLAALVTKLQPDDAGAGLAAAIAALQAGDVASAPRAAGLLIAIASSLGLRTEDDVTNYAALLRPAHQGALPDTAIWYDQREAAKTQRIGETVLTTLLLAQAGDGLTAEPIVLAQAIAGLAAIGLGDDARALALETALNAGI